MLLFFWIKRIMTGGKIYTIKIKTEKTTSNLVRTCQKSESPIKPPQKTPKNPFNLTLKPTGIETF